MPQFCQQKHLRMGAWRSSALTGPGNTRVLATHFLNIGQWSPLGYFDFVLCPFRTMEYVSFVSFFIPRLLNIILVSKNLPFVIWSFFEVTDCVGGSTQNEVICMLLIVKLHITKMVPYNLVWMCIMINKGHKMPPTFKKNYDVTNRKL